MKLATANGTSSLAEVTDLVDYSDRALLERIVSARDTTALKQLYTQYRDRLVPFLARMTEDHGLIEEVYNDVMLTIWNKGHQYAGGSKVSTWVFTIAYRACLRLVERDRARSAVVSSVDADDAELDHRVVDAALSAAGSIDQQRQRYAIRVAMQALPIEQRLALEFCYFHGCSVEEISQIAECPVNTVKTRLHHGRRKLRKLIESSGQPDWETPND